MMKTDKTSKDITSLQLSNAKYFYQWLVAFAPPIAITLAALSIFREVIVRSILSSAHPVLVYLILVVFFTGIVFCAVALYRFQREGHYINRWKRCHFEGGVQDPILARGDQFSSSIALSALALNLPEVERQSRFELEVGAVRSALGEQLAYANYIAGALIGLGLVGTFVGLLGTLEDLGAVFGSLSQTGNSDVNPTAVFANMVDKLQEPMKGMGTAFVSSLYGLLGSLLVGLCALSVSKAGATVVDDLFAAGRSHAALNPALPAVALSTEKQAKDISQLSALFEQLLQAQIDNEHRLKNWFESGEKRVQTILAQVLETSRVTAATMINEQQQVVEKFSTLLGAHDDNAQILATRITEQDQHLTHSIGQLVERHSTDQAVLREDVMGALNRTHADRSQQVEAIFRAIQNVAALTERSTSVLFDHLQKQAKTLSHEARSAATQKSNVSLNAAPREEELHEGIALLAQSIERQTRFLEEALQSDRTNRKM
jgi:hypothetical protein